MCFQWFFFSVGVLTDKRVNLENLDLILYTCKLMDMILLLIIPSHLAELNSSCVLRKYSVTV